MQATYAIELTLRNRVTIAWYLQEEELLLKKELSKQGTLLQNILPKDICLQLIE